MVSFYRRDGYYGILLLDKITMKYFIKRYISGTTGVSGHAIFLEADGKIYFKCSHFFYKTAREYVREQIARNRWAVVAQYEVVYNKDYFQFKSAPNKYYWA